MKMRDKPPCAMDFPDEDSLADLRNVFQCGDFAVRGVRELAVVERWTFRWNVV